MRWGYYNRAGEPIDVDEFARLLGIPDYRVVAKTVVGDREVSTVWLGVDHGFGHAPAPIIFETLVFPECEDMWRYTTEQEARAGHDRVVAGLRGRGEGNLERTD